jgi:signal transduction histidine kinase/ActR/RegA family two-component response regulator
VDDVREEAGATVGTMVPRGAGLPREARWLDALERMAAALDAERDPLQMAGTTLQIAREATGASGGIIALADDGATLKAVRAFGISDEIASQFETILLAAPLPLTDAVRTGAPIALESRAETVARYPMLAAILPPTGHEAGVALPLWADDRPAGVLALTFAERRSVDAAEWRFLEALARLTADGVLRQAAQARERDAAARVAACAEATRAFAEAAGDLDALLATVAREVVRSGVVDLAAVGVITEDEDELSARAMAHRDPAEEARVRSLLARYRFRVGEGVIGGVAASGRTVVYQPDAIASLRQAAAFGLRDEIERLAVRGLFVAPLPAPPGSRRPALGVLVGVRTSNRPFSPEDQALLTELASRAALAIVNARRVVEAEAASRAKDEFLAMLGHELRNPLAPIMTALKLLRDRDSGNGRDRAIASVAAELEVIERQVRHLARLVDDLLDVNRITRGRVTLSCAPVEAAEVVRKAVEIAGPLVEERRHALMIDVPRGHVIEGDEVRLAQVIANLLTNSAKYTPPGGHIRVRSAREGETIVVTVTDDGIGIAPELLPRVFDLFVQGRRGLDRSEGGLGIGLTIVRRLVEMHGGQIRISSAGVGRGTEVVVRLPAAKGARVEAAREEEEEERAAAPKRRRVLVVDDNADAADLLAELLTAAGHEVVVAYDGEQAIERNAEKPCDVAILDLGLPGIDGFEVAERLRARGDGGPTLVALSGYGLENDRRMTARAGFVRHFVKPVDPDRLLAVIAELAQR